MQLLCKRARQTPCEPVHSTKKGLLVALADSRGSFRTRRRICINYIIIDWDLFIMLKDPALCMNIDHIKAVLRTR